MPNKRIIRFKLSKTLYVRDHVILACPDCDATLKKTKHLPRPASKINRQFCKACQKIVTVQVFDHLEEIGNLDDGVIRTRISVQELD